MADKVKGDGRATRWAAHREARRAEFVAAAVRTIDEIGPDASVADIASEAEVSKPVLYRYFGDKAELHAAVGFWAAQTVLDHVVAAVLTPAATRQRVKAGVEAYLDTLAEHPQVYLLLSRQHSGAADPLADGKARIATTFARMVGDAFRKLGVDAGGAEPWAHSLVGIGEATGVWWLERQTMSRDAVARYLSEFIWHALAGTTEEYGVPLASLDRPAGDLADRIIPIREAD